MLSKLPPLECELKTSIYRQNVARFFNFQDSRLLTRPQPSPHRRQLLSHSRRFLQHRTSLPPGHKTTHYSAPTHKTLFPHFPSPSPRPKSQRLKPPGFPSFQTLPLLLCDPKPAGRSDFQPLQRQPSSPSFFPRSFPSASPSISAVTASK